MEARKLVKIEDRNQALVEIAQQQRGSVASVKAINKLIKINGGLIWRVARRLQLSGEFSYLDDIITACQLSILQSLKTYQFGRGSLFITWWVFQMRGAVQAWRRKQGGELYLKQYLQDKKYNTKISPKRVKEFKTFKDIELNPINPDNGSIHEFDLKGLSANAPGVMGEWSLNGLEEAHAGVNGICEKFRSQLTEREIKIIKYRYDHKMPFWQIAEAVGLSKWGVKLVLDKALRKLKEEMKAAA